MIYTLHNDELGFFEIQGYEFIIRDIPMMFLVSLWGFVPAMISFAILLIHSLAFDVTAAYEVSVYLIGAFLFQQFIVHKWYQKKTLSVLAIIITAVSLGGVWNLVEAIASQQGLLSIDMGTYASYIMGTLPEIVVAVVTMWYLYNKTPESIKKIFFIGFLYDDSEMNEDIFIYQQQLNSRLSQKLTGIIVAEAVFLGVASTVFCSELIPSMADNILGTDTTEVTYDWDARDDNMADDSNTSEETQNSDGGSENSEGSSTSNGSSSGDVETKMRFLLNNAGVAFIAKMMILMLNVSVPLIVLANAFVQNRVARPIIAMSHTLQNFAKASREEQDKKLVEMSRMNIKGKDEIAVLYDNLAEMAYEINSFVDQIKREQKLQEDLRVAQIASENKSNFLNNVSHEIRTPINAVLGLDEMILRESTEENIRDYARDIQNSGKTLLSLVNDILDSSKLEAGKMEILPVEYDVSSVINDVVNMISSRAKDKNLDFQLHIDSNIPSILFGDEIRIKQVMINILTNAVKYTEEGQVDFTLGYEKNSEESVYLTCSVKDTGIGIKEEDMKKLFSRFERIDEGKNRTIEGTGLGMNIVKQLLALMDSELQVESVYGEGSEFSFKVAQKVVNWDAMGDYEESYRKAMENERYEESFVAPDALVLVTDDTVMNLTVIKALLKATKVQIETAESGFETLDKVRQKKYDIIFLDHRMPKMDGIETLQKMKELEGNLNIDTPVISLTANAVSGAREVYMAAGFVDYLSKPIDSKKLEHMLMEYLPKEKVLSAHEGVEEAEKVEISEVPIENEIIAAIKEIGILNLADAYLNCGGEDTFIEVLKEYIGSAEKKANDIEGFWQSADYNNYTVLVHALKSSSRLIGANELSEAAKELEALGNEAETGSDEAIISINEKTPDLLKNYRDLYEAHLFVADGEEDDSDKPEIDLESLKDGINTIYEFAQAFDFDSADSVMKMLEMYQMPEAYKTGIKEIKEALAAVDQQLLIEKIEGLGL